MISYRKVPNSNYCYVNDEMLDTQEAMNIARTLIALGLEMIADADKQKLGKDGVFDADAEILAIVEGAVSDYLDNITVLMDDSNDTVFKCHSCSKQCDGHGKEQLHEVYTLCFGQI